MVVYEVDIKAEVVLGVPQLVVTLVVVGTPLTVTNNLVPLEVEIVSTVKVGVP